MAITQAVCNVFKEELLKGSHNLASGGDEIKIALFTSSATLGASTENYAAESNEVANGNGYTTGGNVLENQSVTGGSGNSTAFVNFDAETFPSSTITANGALIYNNGTSATNDAICVLAFGSDKSSTDGDFTITFPTAAASTAIIRIA